AAFRGLVKQRAAGVPVAYLVGYREFYSLPFRVTPDVLIPRPETEMLVMALLDRAQEEHARQAPLAANAGPAVAETAQPAEGSASESAEESGQVAVQSRSRRNHHPWQIADVGTGSGILAVCAARHLPGAEVTAIDISPAALAVAQENAQRHQVADRIDFIESDLFAAVPAGAQFDLIVSNAPYVRSAEMAELPPEVGQDGPHGALAAGPEGTDVIGPLLEQSLERL